MPVVKHYGTPRRSGRYPWGSGKDPYQRHSGFYNTVKELRNEGLSDAEIAAGMGIKTNQLRARYHISKNEIRAADRAQALRLKDKGYSNVAIGERMGINESSVRSLLDPATHQRAMMTKNTADTIRNAVDEKKYIDVGKGMEQYLGVSKTKMDLAISMLQEEGYQVQYLDIQQVGTGKKTRMKVLVPPDVDYKELSANRDKISMIDAYSEDGGRSFRKIVEPNSVSSDRVLIRYAEEGGKYKDGVIELRQGVPDISLGDDAYAQVRIAVDGTHYMKGMAMYGNKKDFPDGIDMIYNVSKPKGTLPEDVFKSIESDPDRPFGSTIRQRHYVDADGNEHLSALNIVGSLPGTGVEGAWNNWKKSLSSQILSKQTPALAKRQLDLALGLKQEEYEEIMSLTNPAVKKRLLETFADQADAAASDLAAAALPRQRSQVLLPVTSLKDNEVFAPNYNDGETVVLIRHPHGGIFEIPTLRVNNKNPEAVNLLGKDAKDVVGINHRVAERLSGADFDGDAVIVIPNKNKYIKTATALSSLKDFDPKTYYPETKGMKYLSKQNKQTEMGKISNLITDMTIKGASYDEIARAVRHSMVVIDAEKHKLNYEQSYLDNGIAALKKRYQGGATKGASTLISKAGATKRVPHREPGVYVTDPKTGKKTKLYVDPKTGKKLYTVTGETYINKDGKRVPATTKTTWMAEVDNAYKLSSGTVIESLYAGHANALKAMARDARLNMLSTKSIPYSPSAYKVYKKEAQSLRSKLKAAYRNKPLERKATLIANHIIRTKRKANPDMDKEQLRKIKWQALEEARARVGAKKSAIEITDREWKAIQAGAISNHALSEILLNTDVAALKQRAMPRAHPVVSPAKAIRAKTMLANGYTRKEVADAIGVSLSSLDRAMEE